MKLNIGDKELSVTNLDVQDVSFEPDITNNNDNDNETNNKQNEFNEFNKEIELKDKEKGPIINGWTKQNQTYFQFCLHRLKYYRIINNFFFFELKKREGRLSWAIIVLSSFSSVLSLINTDNNIFPNSIATIKWTLVIITLIITLISSYIKKQQFIDRINNIDRYMQQLNQVVEELNITFILEPNKRETYEEFCKKYIPLIKNLSISPASFSPTEWKRTVYIITKYYPELINGDGTNEELLWPWFHMHDNEKLNNIPYNKKRTISDFGDTVMKSITEIDKTKVKFLHFV
jgi:hypothetical protein